MPGFLEEVPLHIRRNIILQQDGAPPHNTNVVKAHLNNVFPGRHMSTRGAIKWPARSPDLSPLDFYLWGYLKQIVYQERSNSVEELKEKITAACNEITPHTLAAVTSTALISRFNACSAAGGNHFEQYL